VAAVAAAVTGSGLSAATATAATTESAATATSHAAAATPPAAGTVRYAVGKPACAQTPRKGTATCDAIVRENVPASQAAKDKAHKYVVGAGAKGNGTIGPAGGLTPQDLATAYALNAAGGSGQTVGIVDAYNDPNINADLQTFDSQYGLPACSEGNGCLRVVSETGGTTLPPNDTSGWSLEESLDVEAVATEAPAPTPRRTPTRPAESPAPSSSPSLATTRPPALRPTRSRSTSSSLTGCSGAPNPLWVRGAAVLGPPLREPQAGRERGVARVCGRPDL
jgi:hypothetical protein